MHRCSHGRSIADDPRFAEDDFTQAALRERRVRAAHAHGLALLLSVIGGLLVAAVAKKHGRTCR